MCECVYIYIYMCVCVCVCVCGTRYTNKKRRINFVSLLWTNCANHSLNQFRNVSCIRLVFKKSWHSIILTAETQ